MCASSPRGSVGMEGGEGWSADAAAGWQREGSANQPRGGRDHVAQTPSHSSANMSVWPGVRRRGEIDLAERTHGAVEVAIADRTGVGRAPQLADPPVEVARGPPRCGA